MREMIKGTKDLIGFTVVLLIITLLGIWLSPSHWFIAGKGELVAYLSMIVLMPLATILLIGGDEFSYDK